jgi:hypothetical protein
VGGKENFISKLFLDPEDAERPCAKRLVLFLKFSKAKIFGGKTEH